MREIKCLFVGASRIGKTNVIKAFINDEYQSNYTPTTFETSSGNVLNLIILYGKSSGTFRLYIAA